MDTLKIEKQQFLNHHVRLLLLIYCPAISVNKKAEHAKSNQSLQAQKVIFFLQQIVLSRKFYAELPYQFHLFHKHTYSIAGLKLH